MKVDVPRDDKSGARPYWRLLRDGERRSATLVCPNGHRAALDHDIAADGTVSPSVVCPEDGCDWHVHVRLVGW